MTGSLPCGGATRYRGTPTAPAPAATAGYTTLVGGFESSTPLKATATIDGSVVAPFYVWTRFLPPPTIIATDWTQNSNGITITKTNPAQSSYGAGMAAVCSATLCTNSLAPVNGVKPINHGYGIAYQYGYFEASIETTYNPSGTPQWYPTFWLDGTTPGNARLEIDVFELFQGATTTGAGGTSGANQFGGFGVWASTANPSGNAYPTAFAAANPPNTLVTKTPTVKNIFGMLWTPTTLSYFINVPPNTPAGGGAAAISMNTSIAFTNATTGAGAGNFVFNNLMAQPQYMVVQFGTGNDGLWPGTWNWIRIWQ